MPQSAADQRETTHELLVYNVQCGLCGVKLGGLLNRWVSSIMLPVSSNNMSLTEPDRKVNVSFSFPFRPASETGASLLMRMPTMYKT